MPDDIDSIDRIDGHRSIVDRVTERLRDAIVSGRIRPGSKLPETRLATHFGVSRIPVREALSRLEAEGLLTRVPYRGAVVVKLTADQIAESFTLRALLEGFAARAATPRLSAGDLARLRQLVSEMEECVEAGRYEELPDLHRQFHSTIYSQCGYDKLVSWIEELYHQFPKNLRGTVPSRLREPIDEYTRIVDALEARDAELASSLMSEHLVNGSKPTVEYCARVLPEEETVRG